MEKETQETQNTAPEPEDLEAIKTQLEEEKKAKATADQALNDLSARLAEKDARIAELQAEGEALRAERSNLLVSLSEAQQSAESLRAEGVAISEAHAQAVAKYLDAVRLANPTIPRDIIIGDTIEDIDASLAKATTIANAIRANLEAQVKEAKVPVGAPTRGEISLEGLSPREKIAAGIQQGSQR